MPSEKPKIAIIGYGSMGKEVENIARQRNFTVTDIFELPDKINPKKKYLFDVAIDFSYADSVLENVEAVAALKRNIVIGTTGWSRQLPIINHVAEESGIGVVYGSNFSIGMQFFNKIVELAAQIVNKNDYYDVCIHEMHHKRKMDSPSGSSIALANLILKAAIKKKDILSETSHSAIKETQLHVSSSRCGDITGIHTVYFDSVADSIEMTHRAKNRGGFALGSILAAEWIFGKKGVHIFDEIVDNLWV